MNDPFIGQHYVVALKGWPELPARERIAAEVRFATEFECALGGAEAIPEAWTAYMDALEAGTDDPGVAECAFVRARESAAVAGWQGLAKPPGAYFALETEGDHQVSEIENSYFAGR